jgi:hypothetical protein
VIKKKQPFFLVCLAQKHKIGLVQQLSKFAEENEEKH